MMQTNEPCLPVDLRAWLLASQSEHEANTWSRHIERCARCRSRMGDELPSLAWSTIFSEDVWDHELSSSHEVPKRSTDPRAHDQASLEKLARQVVDKSDNPAMLGRLGEFEILEPIGLGGMSLVLKGYDHELNRFVAIKVLAPHLAIVGVARQRFAREAQAAASIVDPHVVPIHSVVADHDPPYFVMTYIPGQTLQSNIDAEGTLDVLAAVRIAQQVAMGLAAAHAQGLIHRDIKPSNILLERNVQRAYIADFGLARAADDASLTRSGFLAGTPDFMSPEQARGETLDSRSDLFSLGSVLYTMLTGHPPFRAASPMAVLNRISQDTPRSILSYNPRVPIWLADLVERLLSKQPTDRFESAQEVGSLLEAALRHLQDPIACTLPMEFAMRVKKPVYRFVSAKTIGAALCLLIVCVIAAVFWRPSDRLRGPHLSGSASSNAAGPEIGPEIGSAVAISASQSPAKSIDAQWKLRVNELDLALVEVAKQFEMQVSRTTDNLSSASKLVPSDTIESSDKSYVDCLRDIEQQVDQVTLELKSKGKL